MKRLFNAVSSKFEKQRFRQDFACVAGGIAAGVTGGLLLATAPVIGVMAGFATIGFQVACVTVGVGAGLGVNRVLKPWAARGNTN